MIQIPEMLMSVLIVSLLCSVVQAALVQKVKELPIIQKGWITWCVNLVLSFGLGELFSVYFFNMDYYAGAWVGLFCFLGAAGLYEAFIKMKEEKPQLEEKSTKGAK